MPDQDHIFYVYEHWRPDTDRPFYVGKGKGKRAYKLRHNLYWHRVVEKLRKQGLSFEIRFLRRRLSECDAFELERRRIALWRARGISLTNVTDGGEGTSGRVSTPEQRAKISKANAARSPEERTRIAAIQRAANLRRIEEIRALGLANRGRKHTPETRAKISAVHRGRKRPPHVGLRTIEVWLGRKHTPETKAKMREVARLRIEATRAMGLANRGRKHTPEARAKMAEAQRRVSPELTAKRISWLEEARKKGRSPESIEKVAAFHRGRKRSSETCAKMVEAKRRRRAASVSQNA